MDADLSVTPQKMPLFFIIAGTLLCLFLLGQDALLQFVNVHESCSYESVETARKMALSCDFAGSAVFLCGIIFPRRSHVLLLISGILFSVSLSYLFMGICGHESYGSYPILRLGAAILWWIMSLVYIVAR